MSEWMVWECSPFGYRVARRLWADAFGAGYKLARNGFGFCRFFFTRKGAQAEVDRLNANLPRRRCE